MQASQGSEEKVLRVQDPRHSGVAGARRGARSLIGAMPAVAGVGIGFGAAAVEAGLSPAEAIAMSALIFAGAAQFAALELWVAPLPLAALLVMTLAVNARHIVLGATLHPLLAGESHRRKLTVLALLSDANWAAVQDARARGEADLAHLLGGGLALWLAWVVGTAFGAWMGKSIGDLERVGIDAVMPAFFLCSLIGLKGTSADVPPWLAAALASAAASLALQAHWAVLIGIAAGTAVGAVGAR